MIHQSTHFHEKLTFNPFVSEEGKTHASACCEKRLQHRHSAMLVAHIEGACFNSLLVLLRYPFAIFKARQNFTYFLLENWHVCKSVSKKCPKGKCKKVFYHQLLCCTINDLLQKVICWTGKNSKWRKSKLWTIFRTKLSEKVLQSFVHLYAMLQFLQFLIV